MLLRTERLELDPFASHDLDALHALFTAPEVRRYLLDDEVVSRDWVEEEIAQSQARFEAGEGGLWSVHERGSSDIVGFVGFRPFFEPPELQLLYGFLPACWGRGLATEAATAAVDHAFAVLGFREVRAATDVPNTASIAVLERLGMTECDRTEEGPAGTVFFCLDAEDWDLGGG